MLDQIALDAARVRLVGHEHSGLGVAHAVPDPLVAVEHGHRQQDRAGLPHAEERGRGLRRGRQQHRDPVPSLDAVGTQDVREPVGVVLELAPADLPDAAAEVFVDHRRLVARVTIAHVDRDVVARRHLPAVLLARLLVGGESGR